MTRRSCVVMFFVPFLLMNCANNGVECQICGDFDVINFSKSELNLTENEAVSIRRNLSVDNFGGEDYYTIWSWSEQTPDSAWTERMKKDLEMITSDLSIHEDGSWSWSVEVEESFLSSPYFGNRNFRVNKYYFEQGTWRYLNQKRDYIGLNVETAEVQNEVIVLDRENSNQIIEKWPVVTEKYAHEFNQNRRFQVSKTNGLENQITLESVEDDHKIDFENIHNVSYSLVDGDIQLTLNLQQTEGALASKLR